MRETDRDQSAPAVDTERTPSLVDSVLEGMRGFSAVQEQERIAERRITDRDALDAEHLRDTDLRNASSSFSDRSRIIEGTTFGEELRGADAAVVAGQVHDILGPARDFMIRGAENAGVDLSDMPTLRAMIQLSRKLDKAAA